MKLNDMGTKPTTKQMKKVMETRFGFSVNYDELDMKRAYTMATSLTEALNRLKKTHGAHMVERNPKYMEVYMVRESIHSWMRENKNRFLAESEMAKSEAILAAKDMVDSIQDMLEKISKMQNEQLPALLDTIRDQLGIQQADQFKNSVSPLLGDLAQTLQQGRETADTAARVLAGEQVDQGMDMGGMGGGMGSPDMGGDLGGGMGGVDDLGMGGEPTGAVDAAAGGGEELGRERRGMAEAAMSAKQKKFASLAKPKDKITYADKIAGAKKSK